MATYKIPLTPEAQTFSIALAGINYQFKLAWNSIANLWTLDIADANEVPIISGIPLVANTDLLEPYPYLGFNGRLIAQTDGAPNVAPTYENLGSLGQLYFVTP